MNGHWFAFPLSVPQLLSIAEWSIFSFYWSAAAKSASPAKQSESRTSRRVHLILLNTGLVLVALPIPEWTPRFLPGAIWVAWLGSAVQTAACLFAIWARRHLGRNWSGAITIKEDHELIRSGPYRFVRHPIYSGLLGMFAGSVVVNGRYQALLGLALGCLAYWRKIRLEEKNLSMAFGNRYDEYRKETGAVMPAIRVRRYR